ncbi:MAG: DUF4252 domain-containing protein [Bacteroidota bacterium]
MKKWSYLILVMCCCMLGSMLHGQADAISQYFDQYLDDERFTVVYISPKMFQMIQKMDIDWDLEEDETQAVMETVEDLRGLRILISEEDVKALYEEATQKIDTKGYEVLMSVRSKKKSNVQLLVKDDASGNIVNELLMLVGGEDSFVLMSFVGKINLNKVAEMQDSFNK